VRPDGAFRRRRPPRPRLDTVLGTVLVAVLTILSALASGAVAGAQTAPAPPLVDADGVPLGITPPVVGPMPARHHAILAMGDSALAQGLHLLPEVLAQHGIDADVYDAHGNGWGLLDPLDGVMAPDVLDRAVAAHPDLDTVIIGYVGVCAFACGPGGLAYGSARFYAAWDGAARALVTRARIYGLQVVWAVEPPPAPSPSADPPVEDFSSLSMRHEVATNLVEHARAYASAFGIASVDMSQALSDTSGQWQQRLSYDGAVHEVRFDDKVHVTEDGSRRTSLWTVATLAQLWSRPQVESVV
jgi:hypothetical protein